MEPLKNVAEEDFDWSQDPQTLRTIHKRTNFDSIFVKLIAKDVIRVLFPQQLDEDQVHEHLLRPLERFICDLDVNASEEDVMKALDHLQSLNTPSKLCRRILKAGDVVFSCNDCGLDSTCVVCIDCFHKGAHKDHNYRMYNSDGGGCCDCGDIEAWNQNYACTDHMAADQPSANLSNFEDKETRAIQIKKDKSTIVEKINRLPRNIAAKYFMVCNACLNYARTILAWKDYQSLPSQFLIDCTTDPKLGELMSKESSSKNFFTVLFNDEVHTYDFVINTLVKLTKCTKMTASIMASEISREGRSIVANDNYKACKQLKDAITSARDAGQDPLGAEIIHGSVIAHQTFALRIIEWIRKMASHCEAFRALTAFTLLAPSDSIHGIENPVADMTLVERIMLSNTSFWKIVRVEWNELFVTTMLVDYSIKEQFARLITRNYPNLIEDFMLDDHDHSVSILTMTTQLYTVPSLICMLIEEENALTVIMQKLVDMCKSAKRDNAMTMNFERNTFDMHKLRRGFYSITDLRHLINVRPTKWTEGLKNNAIEAVKRFLSLLSSMQNMDSVRRQLGQHIEYEPDWESGMTLQKCLVGFITQLVTYCNHDEDVLIASLKETQSLLLKNGGFKMSTKELFGHQANCILYDVSTSPVSVHLPLTRFAAALTVELMKRRPSDTVPYDESQVILVKPSDSRRKYSMIEIMEPPLRTEVMIAQFRSGMWRRNGYSLVNQIFYYHMPMMRREMFDRDILTLQESAAMTDANEFMIHLINKFQLFHWVRSDATRSRHMVCSTPGIYYNDDEAMTQTMSLGEELLQLLLTIVSERYVVGIGMIEDDDVMKNEVIQLLCINPSTRSELIQRLSVDDNELDCIKAVANLRRSTESSSGKYELKKEFYHRFNPFFYHYSRRNQSNAIDAQLKRKKNLKESLICCPPPKPVELTKQFKNLNELLKCDITLNLVARILRRALDIHDDNQEGLGKQNVKFNASDLQLDQCLHLIGLGLYEQERSPSTFKYIQAAHDKDIFALLRDCFFKAKRSKDLTLWVIQKTGSVLEMMDGLRGVDEEDGDNSAQCFKEVSECFESILSSSDKTKQDSKKHSSELAAQRRQRIMDMMKANQNKFLSNQTTKQLIQDTEAPMECDEEKTTNPLVAPDATHLCILCRDEQPIGFDKPTMVLLAYIQRSAVLSKNRNERRIPNYALTPSNQLKYQYLLHTNSTSLSKTPDIYSYTSDNSWSFDATFMPADLFFGPHVSTCGHSMHYDCWRGFFDAIQKRETSRQNRNHRHVSFELEKHEILCPLCECISNATIPLIPDYTTFSRPMMGPAGVAAPRSSIFMTGPETVARSSESLSACLNALRGTVDAFKHIRHIKDVSTNICVNKEDKYMKLIQPRPINDVLEELGESESLRLRDFISSVRDERISSNNCTKSLLSSIASLSERIHYVGLDLDRSVTDIHHARIFMMTSWSIAYTIQAQERVARFKGVPLLEGIESSRTLCVTALIRAVCASMMTHQSDMIQSLLLRKLRYLVITDEHLSSSPCCLDIDAFETLVSLLILLQKLYVHDDSSEIPLNKSNAADGEQMHCSQEDRGWKFWTTRKYDHEYFRNVLHLMLILNMLQVGISMQNTYNAHDDDNHHHHPGPKLADTEPGAQPPSDPAECQTLQAFFKDIILASGHPSNKVPTVDDTFCKRFKARLLPFLRSCVLFFFHLSRVEPPKVLRTKSAFFEGHDFLHPANEVSDEFLDARQHLWHGEGELDLEATSEEMGAICQYLDLPASLTPLLQSREARHLARGWLRHSRVLPLIKSALKEQEERELAARAPVAKQPAPSGTSRAGAGGLKRASSSNASMHSDISSASSAADSSSAAAAGQTELMPVRLIHQPHAVNRLLELPYDYSELVDKVSDFSCPSIKNEDSRTPTMCLVCGAMLCSQSYCCQRDLNNLASNYQLVLKRQRETRLAAAAASDSGAPNAAGAGAGAQPSSSAAASSTLYHGALSLVPVAAVNLVTQDGTAALATNVAANLAAIANSSSSPSQRELIYVSDSRNVIHQQLVGSCTYHAHECSGGVGVFLRIRNCQILLLSGRSKGCYIAAPYIDDHGETDFGLIRGNPMHLNRQLYEKLQHTWLTHSIPEIISRNLEYSTYASSVGWHLH